MITFAYRARDSRGEQVIGTHEARSAGDALRELQREGKTVTDLRAGQRPTDTEHFRTRLASGGVRREEVIALASQLSVMLETGVPLPDALEAFLKQSRTGSMGRVMSAVSDRIHAGASFSLAMSEFPRVFPGLMVSLMRASEASGSMGAMLGRVGVYLAKERRVVRQIRGALTYPMVMVAMAVLVTGFLMAWVLPRFAKIYASRSAALPKPTRVLMAVSEFVSANWVWLVVAALAAVGGATLARTTVGGRRAIDWLKINGPLIGRMFRTFYLTRATRTLGTLLAAGVPLLEAVRITRGVTENAQWDALWERIESSITSGQTMAVVVQQTRLVPPPVAQMIAAGERSGRLPEVLDRVAASSEADLDEAIKTLTQLIEPAMILFMGAAIGGIAIALLLPIFNVAHVVAH